ncbi:MAG: ethylbenzene dehydrogenase-related protein [Candidatus Scalindua sp.]|nr:ethylbenzene dehydrogenase-related protein [Candidatus Scalindua sp.]
MRMKKYELCNVLKFLKLFIMSIAAFILSTQIGYSQTSQLFRTYKKEVSSKISETNEAIEAGKKLYEKKCYYCHGIKGDGKGSAALRLDPKPRNFVRNEYKVRSTALGELPTDEDLFRIISSGIEGTAMPFWSSLSNEERWQVVYYIKTFNPDFKEKETKVTADEGNIVPESPESVKKGSELFKEAKCIHCHGKDGKADGPITTTLEGVWDLPYQARNLTKGWLFKGGNSVSDIHRTLSSGFNESPMGSYAGYLSSEDRWHLAHFVKSISRGMNTEVVLTSKIAMDDLPTVPDDPMWDTINAVEIPLAGQIVAKPRLWMPSVDSIRIKSFYNNEDIVFLLEWDDKTNVQDETYSDAVALQFPTKIPEAAQKPYFAMGDSGNGVTIWQWRAYDELLENKQQKTDMNGSATATDGGTSISEAEGADSVKNGEAESDVKVPDEGANQEGVAEQEPPKPKFVGFTNMQEMNAKGFKNVALQPSNSQLTKSMGSWKDGKWKVMVTSPIATNDKKIDIQFENGKLIPYALAVWDGSNSERGGLKSVSSWYYLSLETTTPKSVYFYVVIAIIIGTSIQFWVIGRVRRFPPKV